MSRKRHWILRWMWLWGPLMTLLIFGGPTLMLHLVTEEAESCFASIPTRVVPDLPACDHRQHWLKLLVEVPFIGRPAMRAREEIVARMAVWRYLDSAIGEPNREALSTRIDGLGPAAYMIWEGSMRLRMDEVGPPMPVPEPGALACSVGDRETLDARAFSWTQHYTETRTMEAALLEGRFDRAVRLAEHYQGRPNSDLRVRVGALLCAGGQYERGIDQVLSVEADRAEHRTANFASNFGGARVVHEACAHGAKLKVASVPAHGQAGAWDHRARVISMRIRHLRAKHPACDFSDPLACREDEQLSATLEHAREILRADKPRRHRLALFASIADSITSPIVATKYGEPRPGEPALTDHIPMFADEWVAHAHDAPFVTAERYEGAAAHLGELSKAEPTQRLIQALFVQAAVGYANRGDLGAADRCIVKSGLPGASLIITRANAALVAGDRAEARRRASAASPRHPRLLLLRAELSLPNVDLARTLALEALAQGQDSRVVERTRWLLVALGVPSKGNTVVSGQPDAPPRYRYTGSRNALTTDAVRSNNLDDALAVWHRWLSSDNRRESRYLAYANRGDAPAGLTPLLHAGAALSEQFTSEQTEIWLDALMAFDGRRFSLRQVALARWRAATWRADAAAARVWHDHYRKLAVQSQSPTKADLLRALRL